MSNSFKDNDLNELAKRVKVLQGPRVWHWRDGNNNPYCGRENPIMGNGEREYPLVARAQAVGRECNMCRQAAELLRTGFRE